jgi:hypothetical protein
MVTDGFAVTPITDSAARLDVASVRVSRGRWPRRPAALFTPPARYTVGEALIPLPEDEQLPLTGPRRRKPARAFLAQVASVRVVKLFCAERRDRLADGFGSRADNLDSVVATESPSNRGFV